MYIKVSSMLPSNSLPCSQDPAPPPYSVVDASVLNLHSYFLMIHFNIVVSSKRISRKWSLPVM